MIKKGSKTLILYSTVDGHTKSICEYISKNLGKKRSVSISSVEEVKEIDMSEFDELILGASVRYGNHRENVHQFIKENISNLNKLETAFFSVNLTARKPNKNTPETNPYLKKFLKKTDWNPTKLGVFAGKLDYPSYDCINKLAILLIMVITNGPKDLSQVYELTDWERVDDFIKLINS